VSLDVRGLIAAFKEAIEPALAELPQEPNSLGASFSQLTFQGIPISVDPRAEPGTIYLIDTEKGRPGARARGLVLLIDRQSRDAYVRALSENLRYSPIEQTPDDDPGDPMDERLYDILKRRSPEAAERYRLIADSAIDATRRLLREYGLSGIAEALNEPPMGARMTQLGKPVCPLCSINMVFGTGSRAWNCANCRFELKDEYIQRFRGTRRNGPITQTATKRTLNPDLNLETLAVDTRSRHIALEDDE
jgi:hypothetical protein